MAQQWSDFGDQYNNPAGEAYTMPLIRRALETVLFPLLDKILGELDVRNSKPLSVLVLACGTGPEVDVLTERYGSEQVHVLATDFADGMVKATQRLIARKDKASMVETKVMDATNIDLPESSFDVVILFLGPMLLSDPKRGFTEILRVLRPRGLAAFLTPKDIQQYEFIDEARRLIVQARPSHLTSEERWHGIPFKSFLESPMMQTWGQLAFVKDTLAEAGFVETDGMVIPAVCEIPQGEIEAFFSSLLNNPGMQSMQTTFTDEEKKTFEKHIREIVQEKWIHQQVLRLGISGNVAFGYKAHACH